MVPTNTKLNSLLLLLSYPPLAQDSSDDCDSGNDEPSDYLPLERRPSVSVTPQEGAQGGGEQEQGALAR